MHSLPQKLSLHVLVASLGTYLVKSSRDTADAASTKPDAMLKLIVMKTMRAMARGTPTATKDNATGTQDDGWRGGRAERTRGRQMLLLSC